MLDKHVECIVNMGVKELTLRLLVPNLANTKMMQKPGTSSILANGYSSESTQRKLSNEYQHDKV